MTACGVPPCAPEQQSLIQQSQKELSPLHRAPKSTEQPSIPKERGTDRYTNKGMYDERGWCRWRHGDQSQPLNLNASENSIQINSIDKAHKTANTIIVKNLNHRIYSNSLLNSCITKPSKCNNSCNCNGTQSRFFPKVGRKNKFRKKVTIDIDNNIHYHYNDDNNDKASADAPIVCNWSSRGVVGRATPRTEP